MENENIKTGLVGFFDILGYQNLLERNEPEKIAEEVLPILSNIGERVLKNLKELHNSAMSDLKLSPPVQKRLNEMIEMISWLVFSDTVLLTMPIKEEDHYFLRILWGAFLMSALMVQGELFRAGLPPRGVIEYGKFYIRDACFAGRPIVNAYKLCSQIELSACVFSESATKEFFRIKDVGGFFDTFVVEYLVPFKSGERHHLTLMAHTYDFNSPDIHNEVMRAFWGNRKDIPLSVRQKAQNTEQWLEFIEYRRKMNKKKEKAES